MMAHESQHLVPLGLELLLLTWSAGVCATCALFFSSRFCACCIKLAHNITKPLLHRGSNFNDTLILWRGPRGARTPIASALSLGLNFFLAHSLKPHNNTISQDLARIISIKVCYK